MAELSFLEGAAIRQKLAAAYHALEQVPCCAAVGFSFFIQSFCISAWLCSLVWQLVVVAITTWVVC
jgi:hypothetical protein